MIICVSHVYQMAALATLDFVEGKQANRAVCAEQRRLGLEGLPLAGYDKIAPVDRMSYIYADVSDFTDDTLGFARDVLHMAGVAVTQGLNFEPVRRKQTLRCSYASGTADIVEGPERLAAYWAPLGLKRASGGSI